MRGLLLRLMLLDRTAFAATAAWGAAARFLEAAVYGALVH
jgi:hypothetical protein